MDMRKKMKNDTGPVSKVVCQLLKSALVSILFLKT